MDIEWYRRKLSPLENREFTAKYVSVENIEWLSNQLGSRQGRSAIVVRLQDVWENTFDTPPNNHDLMTLAHTLLALGWERTRRRGITWFVMNRKEFEDDYKARARKCR